jgi:hypothetical protein
MTQWATGMLFASRLFLALLFIGVSSAQTTEEYRVYTEQPRLLLRAERIRRLKRERERQSIRWEQFNTLMSGHAQMPEPGFALALYYAVTADAGAGKQAVEWASSATDARQMAMVFDWCQAAMTPAQSKALGARLTRAVASLAGKNDLGSVRDRAFAAIAIAEVDPAASESAIRDIVQNAWRKRLAPPLRDGLILPLDNQLFALYELLHVVRDNLNIDLRDDVRAWFKELPPLHLLSHYPAPYPAPENEYHVQAYDAEAAPDLRRAALSLATELSMVAYDNNSTDSQYLQGWLTQDRFLLRSAFGITYEFLWANPYQPGLSFYHFPLAHHDPKSGSLFVRSSWEDDATWFGKVGREWQLFQDGKITALDMRRPREPIVIGETAIFVAQEPIRFNVKDATRAYVIGLQPRSKYEIEVDDEEMREDSTDGAGTLELLFPPETFTGVRIHAPTGRRPERVSYLDRESIILSKAFSLAATVFAGPVNLKKIEPSGPSAMAPSSR